MASIDDFLDRRWADAKEVLRNLDGDFVQRFESEVQLQALGLETPWAPNVDRVSLQRLASEWHRILEVCLELSPNPPKEMRRCRVDSQEIAPVLLG